MPPYSSGIVTPNSPSSFISSTIDSGKVSSWSKCSALGMIFSSANWRTISVMSRCRSVCSLNEAVSTAIAPTWSGVVECLLSRISAQTWALTCDRPARWRPVAVGGLIGGGSAAEQRRPADRGRGRRTTARVDGRAPGRPGRHPDLGPALRLPLRQLELGLATLQLQEPSADPVGAAGEEQQAVVVVRRARGRPTAVHAVSATRRLARLTRQVRRPPRPFGALDRRVADRHRRGLGGAGDRDRLVDPRLQLGDGRRRRPLGQQPLVGVVAGTVLHALNLGTAQAG